jgi:sugar/nucleoside kinase (ribokinase family)
MAALPVEGQLLAVEAMPTKAGGCAANVAIDLAKQGFSVEVVGCLGRDSAAKVVLDYLGRFGVGCDRIVYCDLLPTSTTVILLVQGQDRRYIHSFGANRAFAISQIDRQWLAELKAFYLGGLFAMPAVKTDECLDLLKFCRNKGIATVVDVVLPHDFAGGDDLRVLLPYVDYFLPNDDEANLITGEADVLAQVSALLEMGAGTVVVTQGKAGAVAARGNDVWQCGACPLKVIDPSGSGDAFACGIITGVLHGWDMPRTLQCASAIGASATQAVGTTDGVFDSRQLESFLAGHPLPVRHSKLNPRSRP